MNVLLDTNVFLRYFLEPRKLKSRALEFLEDFEGEVFLSAASVWEMSIKSALGRLDVPGELQSYVRHRMREANFTELTVTIDHAGAVRSLPMHHADPFDRLLIAQAQLEGLSLMTSDRQFAKYEVRIILA